MDEAIKLYVPKGKAIEKPVETIATDKKPAKRPSSHLAKKKSKWAEFWLDGDAWTEVFSEIAKKEKELEYRHPWVEILHNWILALLGVMIVISLISWGISIHTEHKAQTFAATALADYQAEQQAIEEAKAAEAAAIASSEAEVIKQEARVAAKAIYGIRRFIEKYGYSENDIRTYVRCMADRVDFGGGVNSFESVVSQESQFLGYSDSNQVLDEYVNIAIKELTAWHQEASKPWDIAYVFAELTDKGIFLTTEFNADGYARRVRY